MRRGPFARQHFDDPDIEAGIEEFLDQDVIDLRPHTPLMTDAEADAAHAFDQYASSAYRTDSDLVS